MANEEQDTLPIPGVTAEGGEDPNKTAEKPVEKTPEEVAKEERQREIDEAVKKRLAREQRRHEREMADLRARFENAKRPEVEKPAPGRPDPNDPKWASHDDYLEALADWKAEQKLADFRKQLTEDDGKRKTQAEQDRAAKEFEKRVSKAAEDIPQLEESMDRFFGKHFPKTPTMAKAIMESEVGPEILHYLVEHEEEAEDIADLHYRAAERALLRIEDKILEGKKGKPETKTTTKATAPLKPVGGKSAAPDPNSEKDDAAWLRKRMGRKA